MKRSEVLGLITADSLNVCVAGTHGKTTISTMIAHILRDSGMGSNAFLGGISVNYNTNFWSDKNNICVVEADEYDRSFLKLHRILRSSVLWTPITWIYMEQSRQWKKLSLHLAKK
ncbi:MAG: Mur ligase family protein [Puia sp.]